MHNLEDEEELGFGSTCRILLLLSSCCSSLESKPDSMGSKLRLVYALASA